MRLIVSKSATADLLRLHSFLAELSPDAAQRALSVIVRAIDSLDLFPDRGRPSAVAGTRELIVPFGRSAYVVRFAHDAGREVGGAMCGVLNRAATQLTPNRIQLLVQFHGSSMVVGNYKDAILCRPSSMGGGAIDEGCTLYCVIGAKRP